MQFPPEEGLLIIFYESGMIGGECEHVATLVWRRRIKSDGCVMWNVCKAEEATLDVKYSVL